jgi:hypothetical protein
MLFQSFVDGLHESSRPEESGPHEIRALARIAFSYVTKLDIEVGGYVKGARHNLATGINVT